MSYVQLSSIDNNIILDYPNKDSFFFDQCLSEKSESALFISYEKSDALYIPKNIVDWILYRRNNENIMINSIDHINNNFLFKGNNLLVLYAISAVFSEKIKLIYIDPPYNTGNTFVYKDKFSRPIWLLFMKNRLEIARFFLQQDGIIVIQCDETEHAYLKVLMDELYGIDNFLGSITIQTNPGGRDYKSVARTHEYLLIYGKSENAVLYPLTIEKTFPFVDTFGPFELRSLRNGNTRFHIGNRPNLFYPFYVDSMNPDMNGHCRVSIKKQDTWQAIYPKKTNNVQTVWRWGKKKAEENLGNDTMHSHLIARKSGDDFLIFEKFRKSTRFVRSIWLDKDFQTSKGTKHLNHLFGDRVFDYPKSEMLLSRIIDITTQRGDRVLDFFLGSGTTASVAHKAGRCWIGIEQMDYISDVTIPRLCKMLSGEDGGASHHYNWTGGGEFIYGRFPYEDMNIFPFYQTVPQDNLLTRSFYHIH